MVSWLKFIPEASLVLFLFIDCVIYQLLSARDMAQRTYISRDQIVYSTDKDLYEQDYEASEWDRRFRETEKKTDWILCTYLYIFLWVILIHCLPISEPRSQ